MQWAEQYRYAMALCHGWERSDEATSVVTSGLISAHRVRLSNGFEKPRILVPLRRKLAKLAA